MIDAEWPNEAGGRGSRLTEVRLDSGDECPACQAGRLIRYATRRHAATEVVYLRCKNPSCQARLRTQVLPETIHRRKRRAAA